MYSLIRPTITRKWFSILRCAVTPINLYCGCGSRSRRRSHTTKARVGHPLPQWERELISDRLPLPVPGEGWGKGILATPVHGNDDSSRTFGYSPIVNTT